MKRRIPYVIATYFAAMLGAGAAALAQSAKAPDGLTPAPPAGTAPRDQQTPSTPIDVAIAFAKAIERNDPKAALAASTGSERDDELLSALCAEAGAMRDMQDAAAERFGKEGAAALREPSLADQVLYGREKIAPSGLTATVTFGETAAPDSKTPAPALSLVLTKGEWKVDLASLPQKRDADAIARAKSRANAAESTAVELKGGQFASVREAGASFDKKIDAAFEAEARLARLNAKARERGGDASSAPINKPSPTKTTEPKKDWIGKSATSLRASASNESLAATTRELPDGTRATPLTCKDVIDAKWTADGGAVLLLQNDGVLREVAVPSLVEQRRIDLGSAKPGDLAVARTGICVVLPASDELLILDPATLDLKKRVSVRGIRHITASPMTPFVFVADASDQLSIINTVNAETKTTTAAALTQQAIELNGKLPRKFAKDASPDPADVRIGFHVMNVSPDGSVLYCADHLRLHRLRVRSGTVAYEDSSGEIGSDATQIAISPDGQYVALPIGAGNLELESTPRPPFATYVFRGSDLHKPLLILDAGPHPRSIAFDPVAHAIYTQSDEHQLLVFSAEGELEKKLDLLPGLRLTSRILVHPAGKKLLLLIDQKAVWVTLADATKSEEK